MSDIVERCAQALLIELLGPEGWGECSKESKATWVKWVTAALSALRPGDVLPNGLAVVIRNPTVPELIDRLNEEDSRLDTAP